jgi:hypothetical protein
MMNLDNLVLGGCAGGFYKCVRYPAYPSAAAYYGNTVKVFSSSIIIILQYKFNGIFYGLSAVRS